MVEARSDFLRTLLGEPPAGAASVPWFDRMRAQALERANSVRMPSTRDEEWRFTDLAPLTRLSFQPVSGCTSVAAQDIEERLLPECEGRLVFVDGIWSQELSQASAVTGVHVLNLRQAMAQHGELLEQYLGKLAAPESAFTALNTAFLHDAAIVLVETQRTVAKPVHVLHVATRRDQPHAVYPRTLVVAGPQSRCTIVEDFVALTGDPYAYFSAPITEIAVGRDASVTHARVQREAGEAFQLGSCAVRQNSGSRYELVSITMGARLSRFDLGVLHGGRACESGIDGLALIGRRQLADTHSLVDHAHPEGRLRQLHKSVVGGGAHSVFNGKILVREGAQRTDAGQSCRGLLLSARAHIDAKPQLEIFADDVKCAHGAAIGQLDPEEMFYLQSRGLPRERARNLLTYAFAAEVIERLPVPALRTRLARDVLGRTQEAS